MNDSLVLQNDIRDAAENSTYGEFSPTSLRETPQDAGLTHEQSVKLLRALATNDGFRQRYEQKPAAALMELGVPCETIVHLRAACLAPLKLAGKIAFARALEQFNDNPAQCFDKMVVPDLRLDYRKPA